jgi:membrane-associated phospholipid phosphatase
MPDLSKPWPFGLTRRSAAWFIAGFVVLIVLLHLVDRPVSVFGQEQPAEIRRVFRWLTRWGESDWILVPSLVGVLLAWLLSLVTRDRLRQWARQLMAVCGFIFLGVGVPGLVSALAKRIIGRARPMEWTVDAPLAFTPWNWSAYNYQSFPSGHSTTAFAFALTIAFLWPRSFWPMLLLAVAIALSRIVLGQHYLTDITAGAMLGTVGAFAVRNFFARRGWLFDRLPGGGAVRRPFGPTR